MLNLDNILGKIKEFQKVMHDLQKKLKGRQVEATSGGGMVKVVVDGNQNIVSIHIDPEIVNPNDVKMLEDLIVAAVNEAKKKAEDVARDVMQELVGEVDLQSIQSASKTKGV
ncbi:MAG TPA: YbaB/EbfC family nucleoid-associated protein [bacterium (Candidatus Stahlbacteria)]|nr:YbaB/EbfC family nucleoid-associated protein [Candidatus Stahlbacteria bacterium]